MAARAPGRVPPRIGDKGFHGGPPSVREITLRRTQEQTACQWIHFFRAPVKAKRRALGSEHPLTFGTQHYLAFVYVTQGRLAEAESLYEKTLEMSRRVLGVEHPDTLAAQHELARVYFLQERLTEAESLFQ